ncbi:type 1 glutamine amidotransferase [Parasedimentitalea maritima]|uniref:Type 1 glutamine amidotransferase n=1 Tax=Parasedimentitalea maritima TaxID=2578117 RepID=A0ABY2UTA9_9RHOB|nr:type 1 glutamine amidotransferase [Zongyanglinia marina]TLP61620.1 type 1 glutamine amidotransferase [Zongyanglinia marina]
MKIGILQTGHTAESLIDKHGDFDAMFHKLLAGKEFEFQTWNVVDGIFPPSPDAADGWLITGSKHSAYEDLPWISELVNFLRETYAADRPIVGICFGHQILALALGGTVERFDQGWSIGNQSYQMADGTDLGVVAWHQDQVTKLPQGARAAGGSPFCKNAFITYENRAFTVQAHPEFSAEFGRDLADYRRDVLPPELIEAAKLAYDQPLSTAILANQIAGFFRTRSI